MSHRERQWRPVLLGGGLGALVGTVQLALNTSIGVGFPAMLALFFASVGYLVDRARPWGWALAALFLVGACSGVTYGQSLQDRACPRSVTVEETSVTPGDEILG